MKPTWATVVERPAKRSSRDELADLRRVLASLDPADLRKLLRGLPGQKKGGRPKLWTDMDLGWLNFAVRATMKAADCSERKACALVAGLKPFARVGRPTTLHRKFSETKHSPSLHMKDDAVEELYAEIMKVSLKE